MPSIIYFFFSFAQMIVVLLAISIIILLVVSPILDTGEQDVCAIIATVCFVLMMFFSFLR
ncbi:hypothetical protein CCP3SC1AL1_2570003 [Gammaproteobacteria bacterium]